MLQLFIRHKSIFSDFFEIDSRMQIFVVENAIEFFLPWFMHCKTRQRNVHYAESGSVQTIWAQTKLTNCVADKACSSPHRYVYTSFISITPSISIFQPPRLYFFRSSLEKRNNAIMHAISMALFYTIL